MMAVTFGNAGVVHTITPCEIFEIVFGPIFINNSYFVYQTPRPLYHAGSGARVTGVGEYCMQVLFWDAFSGEHSLRTSDVPMWFSA